LESKKAAFVRRNILIYKENLKRIPQCVLIVSYQELLIFVMKAQNFSRLFFQKIAVDGAGTHHDNTLFERLTVFSRKAVLPFRRFQLMIEGDEPQITPFSSNKVIAKIEGKADPDHGDQVLAHHIFLFDQSFHIF
jgi:hypothetical protein